MAPSLRFSILKGPFIPARFDVREHSGLRFGLITLDDGSDGTNALGSDRLQSIASALDAAEHVDIDAIAVTGNQHWFASGTDLANMRQITERSEAFEIYRSGHGVLRRLGEGKVPTFAFIGGVATGGGLELALHCTYRVAADSVPALGMPDCMLGLVPAWGGCYLTPNLVGARGAVDL